jgi:hypothetical protein
MKIISEILQVIIGLILILLLGVLAYSIYNKDILDFVKDVSLVSTNVRKETPILKGVVNYMDGNFNGATFNTIDSTRGNFVDLSPSINQAGGAEYTYNFWLYVADGAMRDTNKNLGLILRGDKRLVKYNSSNNNYSDDPNGYVLVKNPFIRLGDGGRALIVEFNSIGGPDGVHINPDTNTSSYTNFYQRNKQHIGIYNLGEANLGKWNMVTIVVKETNPKTDIIFRNTAQVMIYVNAFKELDKSVEVDYDGSTDSSTAMKHNNGHLYIKPFAGTSNKPTDFITNPDKEVMISDLTYFNYAIEPSKVIELHKRGYTTASAQIPTSLMLSDLQKTQAAIPLNGKTGILPY